MNNIDITQFSLFCVLTKKCKFNVEKCDVQFFNNYGWINI